MFGFLTSLIPPWFRWLALAGLLAAAGVWHLVQVNAADRAGYARAQAEQAKADAAKSIENARTSILLTERNMEIADEQARLQTERDSARRALAAERYGLRSDTRAFVQRAACADPAATGQPDAAATLGELFGHCADRYSAVAQEADRLKDQVTGFQAYVREMRPPGLASAKPATPQVETP